jgi:hypothetical protein
MPLEMKPVYKKRATTKEVWFSSHTVVQNVASVVIHDDRRWSFEQTIVKIEQRTRTLMLEHEMKPQADAMDAPHEKQTCKQRQS